LSTMHHHRSALASWYHVLLTTLLVAGPVSAADGWMSLFDGKSLTGWKATEHPDSVRVVDGTIACDGPRAHLFYIGADGAADFENFELSVEVRTRPGANSGVYFHAVWLDQGWPTNAGFEIQVNNTQGLFEGNYVENKLTGSLYGIRNTYKSLVRDDEWFTMNIVVRRPTVEVRVNGVLVVDYVEPANAMPEGGPELHRIGHGTFALQCHDENSKVFYRNLRVRRLPPGARADIRQPEWDAQAIQRWKLGRDNFPIADLHTVLGGGRTVDSLLKRSFRTGIFPGIVANAGPAAPVRNDATAAKFLAALHARPVLVGLTLSQPGWESAYAPATLGRFDYVIGEPSPIDESEGPPDEIAVRTMQQAVFMIESSPIDIMTNPLVLPRALANRADVLWSDDLMQPIIAAAVKHGVAFEINAVTHQPSERFIRLAKAAGATFTIGTGAVGRADPDDWSYPLEMQRKVGLRWQDMYMPGHAPTRARRELGK
jgi:3-keto-disaccharide hydrolase